MRNKFKLSRVAASVAVAITGIAASQAAFAGPGFTDVTMADGTSARKQTFFAYSPSGQRVTPIGEAAFLPNANDVTTVDPVTGVSTTVTDRDNTGKALRKFVDPLPLPGAANAKMLADGVTSKYIPVAISTKWVNPQGNLTGHDYYEIAVVEYQEKFHTDLRKASVLRGYVQIDHEASNGRTAIAGSKALALYYPNSSGKVAFGALDVVPADAKPILIAATDAWGKMTGPKVHAKVVDAPHFLGPVIAATKDIPTRLKVYNLLPVGRAEFTQDASGVFQVSKRNGDLFLPVDKSILGAGVGPDGLTEYTQNRASVHLHGGDTPWISDGTPHQWITPAGENDASIAGSLANTFNTDTNLDPAMLPNYLKGVSTQNVPDMNDPGDGAMTLYYPNGQSARFIWYHDHTFGSTRLNVYAGMASGYLVTDAVEQGLVASKVLPDGDHTIPLILQDRTFVPDDIALQDARWNTSAWGQPGDSWFPHVYETVQDPAQANNWNAVGRWHYGPWFWPVFPALYALPEGTYSPAGFENTVTTTPEGWHDTPIINGVAYPTLEVDPTTYRFRLLNATNDRMLTFNLFEAKADATLADGSVVHAMQPDADGVDQPVLTEIDMVPAAAVLADNVCPQVLDADGNPVDARRPSETAPGVWCTPVTWPTDGRIGGVPSPAGVGPNIYQIANEAGWLPKVATFEPTPINYVTDKGRIVVLNVDFGNSGLFLAPAERADVLIDFSQYAGKTLLVYNDSGAPVPAGDPRNDLFTGVGDQTNAGGAEDTKAGYGPNTRTMMQIKVKNVAPAAPLNVPALETAMSSVYFADPERRPVVAQDIYSGYDATWAGMLPKDMYGDIYLGSLKNPTFQFTPGTPSDGIASVAVTAQGAGYVVAPRVTIPAPVGGQQATAVSTMKLDQVAVTNPGKGYTSAPLVTFAGGGGNGAMANAYLRVDPTTFAFSSVGNYGAFNGNLQVSFTPAPAKATNAPAGVTATGYAVVSAGKVTGIVVTNPGSGYTATPMVSIISKQVTVDPVTNAISVGLAIPGTAAKATVKSVVDSVVLIGMDNTTPEMQALTSGGGGYTDLTTLQVNLRGGLPLDPVTGLAIGTPAAARATGKVFDITLTHPGSGYTVAVTPVIEQVINGAVVDPTTPATANASAAAVAGAKASYLVKTKTIQELFDPTYGRLNATLGVELPFTSALTQTTIPLGYVDETTEQFADGETQIWKITHNGVDSHPVHFHLLNVQVINRVGWDGFIQPIEPREAGWKETVMMSPLEDIIVAVRAKKPTLPGFGVPLSQRLMDPTQPEGSPFGFTQIDPVTGNPQIVTNKMVNYGWEYVWHCHILGHEENDFMRPINFAANEMIPAAPTLAAPAVAGTTATVSFTDNSATEFKFSVRRADADVNGNVVGAYAEVGTELALSTPTAGSSVTDATLAADSVYSYVVAAVGAAGEGVSLSQVVSTYVAPTMPSALATANSDTQVTLTWTASTPVKSYSIVRTGGVGAPVTFTAAAADTSLIDNTVVPDTAYSYVVTAVNGDKQTASAPATVTTPGLVIPPASAVVGYLSAASAITLRWTDNSATENNFQVWRRIGAGVATMVGTVTSTPAQRTATGRTVTFVNNTGIANGQTYTYYVVAVSTAPVAQSVVSNTTTVRVAAPAVPAGVTVASVVRNTTLLGTPAATDAVTLNWTQTGTVPATRVTVQWATNSTFTTGLGSASNVAVNGATTVTVNVNRGTGVAPVPAALYFRMFANNPRGSSAYSVGTPLVPLQ